MTKCNDCKNKIADSAKVCPHCGSTQPNYPDWWYLVLFALAYLAVKYIFGIDLFDVVMDELWPD